VTTFFISARGNDGVPNPDLVLSSGSSPNGSPTVLRKPKLWSATARWRQSQVLGFQRFPTPCFCTTYLSTKSHRRYKETKTFQIWSTSHVVKCALWVACTLFIDVLSHNWWNVSSGIQNVHFFLSESKRWHHTQFSDKLWENGLEGALFPCATKEDHNRDKLKILSRSSRTFYIWFIGSVAYLLATWKITWQLRSSLESHKSPKPARQYRNNRLNDWVYSPYDWISAHRGSITSTAQLLQISPQKHFLRWIRSFQGLP